MSDLFHESLPDAAIDQVFAVMALCPQHTFQLLTKRADRMRAYFADTGDYTDQWYRRVFFVTQRMREDGTFQMPVDYDRQYDIGYAIGSLTCGGHTGRFLNNVWLGVSVENQRFADERIPLLLRTPAALRFISAEPLLGPVDLTRIAVESWAHSSFDALTGWPAGEEPSRGDRGFGEVGPCHRLDWVIVGGESGAKARNMHVDWARSIVQQCQSANVACFMKQLGRWPLASRKEAPVWCELRDKARGGTLTGEWGIEVGRDSHGADMTYWPSDLRVRQFPEARV